MKNKIPSGITHIIINVVLTVILLFTIFDFFPDIDHSVTTKGLSFKTRIINLAKGFLGIKHEYTFSRGVLHNVYIWLSIYLIGLLGLVHILTDKIG